MKTSEDSLKVDAALLALKKGKLIGIPTETVYGLASPIDNVRLLEKIFHIKERPFFDPLIVHVSDMTMAKSLVEQWPAVADELAKEFWPGPLTLVLKKRPTVEDIITSGLETVGIRMPDHPLTLEFIKQLGKPVAAPSANKFKRTSPTTAQHVLESFSSSDVHVIEGGDSKVGIESTILLLEEKSASILRKGMISKDQVEVVLRRYGIKLVENNSGKIQAPGQIEHHYMPSVPVIFVPDTNSDWMAKVNNKEWVKKPMKLDLGIDPFIAARKLYSELRHLAAEGSCIYWTLRPIHRNDPFWDALIDRLRRATSLSLE